MDDAQLSQRLTAIERQLTLVSQQLGIPCPAFVGDLLAAEGSSRVGADNSAQDASGLPVDVVELARAGHTTQAISRLRQLTGASLLEAKRAVEAL